MPQTEQERAHNLIASSGTDVYFVLPYSGRILPREKVLI